MVEPTDPKECHLDARLTEYECDFLWRITVDLLSPELLNGYRQEVLLYCMQFWSIKMSEYYLTGRQLRALGFILNIALRDLGKLSQEAKTKECTDLSFALARLPLFMHRKMSWEEVLEPLRDYERLYPEGEFHYVRHLIKIRDKPNHC